MKFIKDAWGLILAIGGALIAFFLYQNLRGYRRASTEWQAIAEQRAKADVQAGIGSAEQALHKAKRYSEEAKAIKEKAEKQNERIRKNNATIADMVSTWN